MINIFTQGNSKDKLRLIPDKSVRCCVTSPPYFGLRDYGTGKWEGGGEDCDHLGKPFRTKENVNTHTGPGTDDKNKDDRQPMKNVCEKCGARRVDEQIGLEETPEQYIAALVEIFEIVKQKLTDDGTLWVNIGDSYAGSGKGNNPDGTPHPSKLTAKQGTQLGTSEGIQTPNKASAIGLKPKDLIGIPWMLAFALRSAGWYLRQDIIWHKPNPMPESVTDRCTKAHEYIFLFSKSREYYFDADAIKVPAITAENRPAGVVRNREYGYDSKENLHPEAYMKSAAGAQNRRPRKPGADDIREFANKRDVWTVNTKPYKGAHFATFPPELITPCVLAGCPVGGVVYDPFAGSGTVAEVCVKTGRNYILSELNPDYIPLIHERVNKAKISLK